ncbi:NB-ARC domain-containing disease resistance protein [Zostera marina]|uniref:NB-ARC domain-containing disease resistance protein n=1 Tax=Zostera marina TaxID=29655 RepID=A0A0K9NMX1_ZOSMR|nr:NB-ARC domain-containing disease resistance protein [Zostera marina]
MESVLISFILEEASKHLIKVLGAEFTLIKNTPGELEKLKRFKTIIVNVQRDVAGRELSQQDVVWLDEMIDAAYDIEDIVDLFNTKILRRRSNNNRISTRYTRRVIDFFSCTNNTLIFRHKIGTRVQNTFVRLANIAEEKKYHLTLSGRDGVENLRSTMPETFSEMGEDDVLVLVGMGGVGKTTLAKLVYNDSQVDAIFGKRKLWVCVSENFDLSKIIKLVIEQIDGHPCQLEGLQALSKKLKELLEKNTYLLVLDDVWTSSSLTLDSWSIMKSLFRNCKILVTTREENVKYVILPESCIHRVGYLSYDDSRTLFENIAFPNGDVPEKLKDISKSIVKKCDGVPLSLKVLGSMMRTNQDYSYWIGIEKNNILDPNIKGENRIFKILKFSYYHLPLKSKFCFVYCSIFPKDSVMFKIDLIRQWVGNGFIPLNEGNEIFDDLLSRCFFQDVEKDVYGSITTFKMHDLIHDLAESIAKSLQCGILDDSIQDRNLSDRKQVRYLSIILNMGKEEEASYSNILIKLKDACVLRTLQLLSYGIVSKTFLDNCFTKFKFLRVLVCFAQSNLEDIPPSINNLKLLRYVDFSFTNIRQLPETVCNLQNLQTLKLNNCRYLIVLPKKLRKLSELRYLTNDNCSGLDSMPDGMDRLSLLQTLDIFAVNDGGKNLNDLRHLNHLEGSLCIKNLHRSRNVVLENGILKSKSKLVSLELNFGYNCKPTEDVKVL